MSDKKKAAVSKNDKAKKPGFFARLGKKIKDGFVGMATELKKVTWPGFPKVVKQTGIVLGVVLLFLVVISAFDFGLQAIMRLVVKG